MLKTLMPMIVLLNGVELGSGRPPLSPPRRAAFSTGSTRRPRPQTLRLRMPATPPPAPQEPPSPQGSMPPPVWPHLSQWQEASSRPPAPQAPRENVEEALHNIRMTRREFDRLASQFTNLRVTPPSSTGNQLLPLELNAHFWEANRPSSTASGSLQGNVGGPRDEYFDSLRSEAGGDPPTDMIDLADRVDSADESRSGASSASLLSVSELIRELGARSVRPLNSFLSELKRRIYLKFRRSSNR